MTGALVAVGRGRLSVPQLKELLEARDSLAYPQGLVAPAHGLFLTRVDYRQTGVEADNRLNLTQSHILIIHLELFLNGCTLLPTTFPPKILLIIIKTNKRC